MTTQFYELSFGRALRTLFLALLVTLPASLNARQVSADEPPVVTVRSEVDRNVITVGDRILLSVIIQAGPTIVLDHAGDVDNFGLFEVLERRPPAMQSTANGDQAVRWEYVITGFLPGITRLPGLRIGFTDAAGRQQAADAPDLSVTIRSVLEEDVDPQLIDLKPPLAIPGAANTTARSLASTLLVAGMLALAVITLSRMPRRRTLTLAPARTHPEAVARRELEAIVADGLLEKGDYNAFYRRLAFCIRQYLEDRYGLPALSRTSTELTGEMIRHGTDRWQVRIVSGLLEECDAVRWAGYQPAGARAQRDLDLAFEIIEMAAVPAERVLAR